MKQATLIDYISAKVHKEGITENYKGTRSPSPSLTMQNEEKYP